MFGVEQEKVFHHFLHNKKFLRISISSTDDGFNTFSILKTDYDNYIMIHLINKKDGKTFQLMELYGKVLSHRHCSWGGKRRKNL
jgi:hypothetical protein